MWSGQFMSATAITIVHKTTNTTIVIRSVILKKYSRLKSKSLRHVEQ